MSAKLSAIVDALEEIAPLNLAEAWDNVGLLIEPSKPKSVRTVLLTIDLTEAVLDEAVDAKADLIVAYHPPIFDALKQLTSHEPKQRVALRAIEARIALYSPHTALDSAPGGVNDWLASGLGPVQSIKPATAPGFETPLENCKLIVFVPPDHADALRDALANIPAVGWIGAYHHCSFNAEGVGTFWGTEGSNPAIGRAGQLERVHEIRMEMACSEHSLPAIADAIDRVHPYEEPAWEVYKLQPKAIPGSGQGRVARLKQPISVSALANRVKKHLGLKHVRIAVPPSRKTVTAVAFCAGAGGSVFKNILCDAYVTGEMRHHDVLDKLAQGSAVILTEHTNSERPYLPVLKKKLQAKLGRSVRIDISRADREPLRIV